MRGPRSSFPGAIFHVINRFVDRHPFFKRINDYNFFLDTYFKTAQTYDLKTYAYCLMSNHFHIVLETPDGEISKFLQRFLTHVAKHMNQKMNRKGHLFQGRSKTLVVQEEKYFSTVIQYTLMNPVKANICKNILDYRWSSAQEMLKIKNCRISKKELFTKLFGTEQKNIGEHTMNKYFHEWINGIEGSLVHKKFQEGHKGGFLSSQEFREEVLDSIERRKTESLKKGRRSTDREKAETRLKWKQFQKMIKTHILKHSQELQLSSWQSLSKAIQQVSWYIAFQEKGLSYEQIRQNEYDLGNSITISGIFSAIRRIKKSPIKTHAIQKIYNSINNIELKR